MIIKSGKIQGLANLTSTVIGNVSFLLALLVAGFFVAKGSLEVGAMMAFVQLMNYLVNPFSTLPGLLTNMQQALAGAERIFQLIDGPKEYNELPGKSVVNDSFSELVVSSVNFSYSDENKSNALNELSFEVQSGQMVAIVGPSGSGKTTLFKLLMGFYKHSQGSINIDGQDIANMGLRKLRDYFSLVPQDSILFTGTIKDNISAGNPLASESEIISAVKIANAYEFIVKLPEGLNTEIGEKGARLSGGQKQRLAIARAILRNAPILLLDEATAALDNKSEKVIQDALNKLMIGRTTLVIAHRLTTIHNADLILVMEEGKIVEQGKHDELITKLGKYHSLYYSQLEKEDETLVFENM